MKTNLSCISEFLKKNVVYICIVAVACLITAVVCLYQYLHYSRLRPIDLSDYPEMAVDYSIDDIHWKDPDYDYITGSLALEGSPISSYPVSLVFYLDDSDTAYAIPAKLKNHYEPEQEAYNATLWPDRDFMFLDAEYLYNAECPSEYSEFYSLIHRDNPLRRTYKIGFLINIDDTEYLTKTDRVYKYEE